MPPTMTTRSTDRPDIASRGGGTGGRVGRGGGKTKGRSGDQGDGMVAATEPKKIQKTMQIVGTLTDEALRNRSIKKNHKKRGNRGEPSRDRNLRDDNKRTRTGNVLATTTNPVRGEYTGHFAKDCRVAPRNVNLVNAR
uniref:Reverse transcriptase domain-containing protein n=1 Tax=Tanacetum cinerariifolium TaxID=118510 RepID=A0A699KM80_TANCI|nr:hypothetical protein [Tanacetum cinerariifolium]